MTGDQGDLFDPPKEDEKPWNPKHHHHAGGLDTEVAAAHSAEELSSQHCQMIERVVKASPAGLNCQEIGDLVGLNINQVGRRLKDCRKRDKRFMDSGIRRPTDSGRQAAVWIIGEEVEDNPQQEKEPL